MGHTFQLTDSGELLKIVYLLPPFLSSLAQNLAKHFSKFQPISRGEMPFDLPLSSIELIQLQLE